VRAWSVERQSVERRSVGSIERSDWSDESDGLKRLGGDYKNS
jgi:hypothetical protein